MVLEFGFPGWDWHTLSTENEINDINVNMVDLKHNNVNGSTNCNYYSVLHDDIWFTCPFQNNTFNYVSINNKIKK